MAGLAPLYSQAVDSLTPMQDLRVLGPLRAARHENRHDASIVKVLDALVPQVAEGLMAVLRIERDGLPTQPSAMVDLDLDAVGGAEVV